MRTSLCITFMMCIFLHIAMIAQSNGLPQANKITISGSYSLKEIFKTIRKKTGTDIVYTSRLLDDKEVVHISVQNGTVDDVLRDALVGKKIEWKEVDTYITLYPAVSKDLMDSSKVKLPPAVTLKGQVLDASGTPVIGATIRVKGGSNGASTDEHGRFSVANVVINSWVTVTSVGFKGKEVLVKGSNLVVELEPDVRSLDEAVATAYGVTSQRFNLGNITKVSGEDIAKQPVINPITALEGRVPGLFIVQASGLPGSSIKVQLRGLNSIASSTDPFYVVDGIPYNSQLPASTLSASIGAGSPLNFINPSDIESIEVLKDADATSIYGSRAANGAILISTKKGKAGPMKVNFNVYSGFSSPARDIKLLNTQQYLTMRNEAFKNENTTPSNGDHDINGDWDTTRYTNWSNVLTRHSSSFTNSDLSLSGGNENAQYLIGGTFRRQTTGFPPAFSRGTGADKQSSIHFNLNSISTNKKFRVSLSGSYLTDKNSVLSIDLTQSRLFYAPDAPPLYNIDGSLNWAPLHPGEAGSWLNPFSSLFGKYQGINSNLLGNASVSYILLPGLELKATAGFNSLRGDELNTVPTTEYDPAENISSGSTTFQSTNSHSWIIEPQINYKKNILEGTLSVLVGATFNESNSAAQRFSASGFSSDGLLENIQAAASITSQSNSAQYKYNAVFGRLSYNLSEKYLVTATVRRDGSSRFGPGKQFSNFWSIGAGWIFSEENIIKQKFTFLSFGKLRGSYGTTGNDQVGDYRFLEAYAVTPYAYQGLQGLAPANLFNPNLAWELTRKLEGGLELGFLKDRISLQASYYRNRSNNMLLTNPLSVVTGFIDVSSNLPALVQNSGIELTLSSINIRRKNFSWSSSLNFSTANNKLLSFPDLSSSGYQSFLVVGKPLNVQKIYKFAGVNSDNGLYQFYNNKGVLTQTPDPTTDFNSIITTMPKYYGGFQNSFSYRGFTLDFLFQFVNQKGKNFIGDYLTLPGTMANQPTYIMDRWQKNGDHKKYQRFGLGGDALNSYYSAMSSDFVYGDASYIRLKNLSFSWLIPSSWRQKFHVENCRVYIQAQNIFTISKYEGIDPESQGIGTPPMKVWTMGLQITL
jgi:TonB-dependent starch-binding outer membrane protein SusC